MYGIEIPRSVDHAYKIDKKNRDTLWWYVIHKETHNFVIYFEILYHNRHVPLGWNKVTGHMSFEVNMGFTKNARWLLDEQTNPDQEVSLYAGVVSDGYY